MSAVARLLRGIGSLIVLALVLGGAPWLLVRIGRFDIVEQLDLSRLFTTNDGGQLLLLALTVLAWASWLWVAATVVSELVLTLTRSRVRIPVPGSDWLRPVVATLVASVVGLLIAQALRGGGPAPSVGAPVPSASTGLPAPGSSTPTAAARSTSTPAASSTSAPAPSSPVGRRHATSPPTGATATSTSSGGAPGQSGSSTRAGTGGGQQSMQDTAARDRTQGLYLVKPHDDLWDLAARLYGDPTRWRDLARANQLSTPGILQPGIALHIPGLGQTEVDRLTGQPAIDTSTRAVTVRPGDTLATLAARHLGNEAFWPALQQANQTLVRDANRLQVGWVLQLPPRYVAQVGPGGSRSGGSRAGGSGAGAPGSATAPGSSTGPRSSSLPSARPSPTIHPTSTPSAGQSAATAPSPSHGPSATGSATSVGPTAASTSAAATNAPMATGAQNPGSTAPGSTAPGSTARGATAAGSLPPGAGANAPVSASSAPVSASSAPVSASSVPVSTSSSTLVSTASTSSVAPTSVSTESAPASAESQPEASDLDQRVFREVLGGLAAIVAAGIVLTLRHRRHQQDFTRPMGRRHRRPGTAAQDFDAALGRALGTADPAELPPALLGPTAVVVGEPADATARPVMVDLVDAAGLTIVGPRDLVGAAGTAVALGLATAPWSQGTEVHLVGERLAWLADLDHPLVVTHGFDEGIAAVLATCRRGDGPVLRALPAPSATTRDRSDEGDEGSDPGETDVVVWVVDLCGQPTLRQSNLLDDISAASRRTTSVVMVWLTDLDADTVGDLLAEAGSEPGDILRLVSDQQAELTGVPEHFVPNLVGEAARRATVELFATADDDTTVAAPWWTPEPPTPEPRTPGPPAPEPAMPAQTPLAAPAAGDSASRPTPSITHTGPEEPEARHAASGHRPFPAPNPTHEARGTTPAPHIHPAPRVADTATSWNGEPSTSTTPALGGLTVLPLSSGGPNRPATARLPLTRRPDTEHVEAIMARLPEVLSEPDHPTLLMLGEVQLLGTRGTPPNRALKQCQEYCGWILFHPGMTSVTMQRSLLVAETTRRSNMSRLRGWLGSTPDGEAYLPDAYSGRIRLHPTVTSDWEYLQLLISAGVARASDDALVEALELVRGAPLADAAPGQWHWAEEVRVEMCQTIRDIGLLLGQRALASRDLDLARWAVSRAFTAAPEDEQLLCLRLRVEHAAGNQPEVERLVLHLTRAARALGVDLADETVVLLQQVMEGRVRARA